MSKDRNYNCIDRSSFTKQNISITLIARYEKKTNEYLFLWKQKNASKFFSALSEIF